MLVYLAGESVMKSVSKKMIRKIFKTETFIDTPWIYYIQTTLKCKSIKAELY